MRWLAAHLSLRSPPDRRTPARGLKARAVYWRVVSMLLLAMAQRVSLAAKMRNHSDAAFAHLLEAALYTALIDLSADIAAHTAADTARSQEDKDALAYLKIAHALLGVTALLIRQLRTDLEIAAARFAALAGPALSARGEAYSVQIAMAISKAPP